MEYLEINEIREIDGVKVQCVDRDEIYDNPEGSRPVACDLCALCMSDQCTNFECLPFTREDGKSVYFKRIEQ